MAQIKSFRDLNVYKQAGQAAKRVFEISKSFPAEERYSLTDQIRRASRAVNAMIAEAWARRRYPAVFRNKLDEALGEANETQAWLDHAISCKYIDVITYRTSDAEWQSVGGMITRMIERADDFCGRATRERKT
jgi:four helix bundle protein